MSIDWHASFIAKVAAGAVLLVITSGLTWVVSTSNQLARLEEREAAALRHGQRREQWVDEATKSREDSIRRMADTINQLGGKVILQEQRHEDLEERQEQVERLLRYWRRQGWEVPI